MSILNSRSNLSIRAEIAVAGMHLSCDLSRSAIAGDLPRRELHLTDHSR